MNVEETIRDIKKELHASMNGVASARMREAGFPFHVIFGVELPRLREIAAQYTKDRQLGQQLWNENVRESQLLGILLTPQEEYLPEVADIWVHEAKTAESVCLISMELVFGQRWASDMAFRWIAEGTEFPALCGWLTICRMLRTGSKLTQRSEAELRDHASAVSDDAPLQLRKAVMQTIEELETNIETI